MSKHDRKLVAILVEKIRTTAVPIIKECTTQAKKVFTEEFGIASHLNFRCTSKEQARKNLSYFQKQNFCPEW